MEDHDLWVKAQIDEAMDKAERGESVYFTSEETEKKMDEFKRNLKEAKQ